ncbi:MAG: hypothetical protein H0T68_01865 [Gemmatimonadales bacterium]|nr:hypothetical protein [Gemmatimonadales bacterium]
MFVRLQAQLHEVRLELYRAWLGGRERLALRRLGEAVTASGTIAGNRELGRLREEVAEALGRIEALTAERRATVEADRADLADAAPWMRPMVVLRGVCARLVLRHRQSLLRRALRPRYEAIGELAAASPEVWCPLEREVSAIRAEIARVLRARERWVAPFGGTALPAWSARVRSETAGFGRAVARQLRSHFMPKTPALAGLVVGWWIVNTYTDSHLRSTLRSIGIGSGGTRVVSSSTYEAMSFWLPLLAAALCAYLGERVGTFYGERGAEAGVKGEG